jgi:hypothetical protein
MAPVVTRQTLPMAHVHGARVAMAGCGIFVVLLVALHFLKPEIDPSWRFISEYALGAYGWLMGIAFLALAMAYSGLAIALSSYLRSLGGRIGLALLLTSALGLALAGLFTTDAITVGPGSTTTSGSIHNLGGTLGMAMPFAAALVTWELRKHPEWAAAHHRLAGVAIAAVIVFLLTLLCFAMMLSRSNGAFGPDVLVGWPNRVEVLTYCVWLMVAAHSATRVTTE